MEKIRIFAFADEAANDLKGQIAAMHRNGLQGLEIRNVEGKNVSDLTGAEAKEIKKQLDAAGLITWCIGSPIGKIHITKDDFAAHLDRFKNTIEVAHILGAENIRLFSFFMPQGEDPAIYRDEVIDRMRKFVEVAAGSGVTLCHENEKGIYGAVASRCLDIHENVPELRAVFDPANFIQCGQETLSAWEMLAPYVKYMHIKDALESGAVVPAGKGAGNLPAIVSKFIAGGGKEFTIEPHLKVFDGLAALEREGEKSVVGETFAYESKAAAFDTACTVFKALL